MAKGEKKKQKLVDAAKALSEERDCQHSLTAQGTIRPYGEEDLTRIREMESIFERAIEGRRHPEQEGSRTRLEDYERLKDYYENGQWLEDYEADDAGLIPSDLKRGILSQDALYDFLSEE